MNSQDDVNIKMLMSQSAQIIKVCQPNFQNSSSQFQSSMNYMEGKKTGKIPSYVFDTSQPNPHVQADTQKYVQKLRSKKIRQNQTNFIRKSELGENQLTFTKSEELKLEIIDEFLEKGYDIPDPFAIKLQPDINDYPWPEQQTNQSKKDSEGQIQDCSEQKVGPMTKELKIFQQWGEKGNFSSINTLDTSLIHYLEDLNLLKLQKAKKKSKQLKPLNFQQISSHNKSQQYDKLKKNQKNKEIQASNKVSSVNKIRLIAPKVLLAQFEPQKYYQYAQQQKFPPIKELSNKKISIKQVNTYKRKQKLAQVSQYMLKKYLHNKPDSHYMTDQRYQAMYQCQMIKGAKQIMDYKDYVNLGFMMMKDNEASKQNFNYQNDSEFKTKKQKYNSFDNYYESQAPQMPRQEQQIDKILEKNRLRLKIEKQRVIEKLRC